MANQFQIHKQNLSKLKKEAKGLDQKELRHIARALRSTLGEVAFYLDVRNEQGRGGK